MNGYATAQREYDMMSDEPTYAQLLERNERLREELEAIKEEYAMLRDYADEVDGKLERRTKELETVYAMVGMDVKIGG